MKCCVESCSNSENLREITGHNITFHLFPKDPKQRAEWVEALGITEWQPTDRTVICSEHFKEEDFQDTRRGVRRIGSDAVPFIVKEDLNAPAALRVCKICLALDTKMYNIWDYKLDQMYENITGIPCCDDEDMLPQRVCWECAARLTAAASLRDKALLSDGLLHNLLKTDAHIKVCDIISISKNYSNLKSSLGVRKQPDIEDLDECRQNVYMKTNEVEKPCNDTEETEIDLGITETTIKDEERIGIKFEENYEMLVDEDEQFDNETIKTDVDLVHTEVENTVGNKMMRQQRTDDTYAEFLQFSEDYDEMSSIEVYDKNESPDIHIDHNGMSLSKVYNKKENIIVDTLSGGEEVTTEVDVVTKDNKKNIAVKKTKDNIEEKNNPGTSRKRVRRRNGPFKSSIDETLFTITAIPREQLLEEMMQRKESPKYINAPYKCTVCYSGFPIKEKYTRHALKHSEHSGAYQCGICKTRKKTLVLIQTHEARQHSQEYRCNQCPYVSRNRGGAQSHMKFHAGDRYKCKHCASEFDKMPSYLNHLRMRHPSDSVCHLCGYTFVSNNGVMKHKKIRHALVDEDMILEGPYCEVCDVKFATQEAYDRHMKLSSKHIKCEDPNRISNDTSLRSRRESRLGLSIMQGGKPVIQPGEPDETQPNKPVKCDQCGMVLKNLRGYLYHFKSVHPEIYQARHPPTDNSYMCEKCGKIFLNTTSLANHMWVHTGKKPFQCEHCSKSFSKKPNLAAHMRHHHVTQPPYECHVCGQLFSTTHSKSRHMLIHTVRYKFICEECGKFFPSSGTLRAHMDFVHFKNSRPKKGRRNIKLDMSTIEEY